MRAGDDEMVFVFSGEISGPIWKIQLKAKNAEHAREWAVAALKARDELRQKASLGVRVDAAGAGRASASCACGTDAMGLHMMVFGSCRRVARAVVCAREDDRSVHYTAWSDRTHSPAWPPRHPSRAQERAGALPTPLLVETDYPDHTTV